MTVDEVLLAGSGNAKKARDISKLCGLDVRGVTKEVRELIRKGVPVAASTDHLTGGYYITETRDEADHYILFMRGHIYELARRMRDYKYAARPIFYPGQLPLI